MRTLPPLAPGALLALALVSGCRRPDPSATASSRGALFSPRVIPVRVVQMVGPCSRCDPTLACSPEDRCSELPCAPDPLRLQSLQERISEANQVYGKSGVSFSLGSLEKHAMPDLVDVNRGEALPWGRVRFQLRQALPWMGCDAFPDTTALPPREWLIRASTLFSPAEAIPFWVTTVSMGGYGIYPWRARAILIDANQINRYRDTNFSHEIGHFLGLPHTFGSPRRFFQGSYNLEPGTLRAPPETRSAGLGLFWEFMVYPAPSGPRFFLEPGALRAEEEGALRPIQWWDLPGAHPSNCWLERDTCRYSCQVGNERIEGEDPRLRAFSFREVALDAPGGAHRGINVMDYLQSPACRANSIAPSQVEQIHRVLLHDVPLDAAWARGLTGLRPRLGYPPGAVPLARIAIDHDFDGQPAAAAQPGMHPPWADDLLEPGEPAHAPERLAGP